MPELLTYQAPDFVWLGGYETREAPKAAGLVWSRIVAGRWATRDPHAAARLVQYADPSCRAQLEAVARAEREATQASRATDAEIEIPAPEGLAYLPFQRAGIAFMDGRPGVLLADEMGLGKTIQVLGEINLRPEWRRVLVICPASLKLNWRREAEKWLVEPWQVIVGSSRDCPVTAEWPAGRTMLILNYDITDRHEHKLRAVAWDCLIADEAHFLKSPTARRTMMILGADARTIKRAQARKSKTADGRETIEPIPAAFRRYLTGTPIPNCPLEAWPLVHSLAPHIFRTFWAYASEFCGAHQGRFGWDVSGATNLPRFSALLRANIMVRRIKSEVLTELPPLRRQVVELAVNGAEHVVAAEREAFGRHQATLEELCAQAELAKASEDPADYKAAVGRLSEAARVSFAEMAKRRHDTAVAKVPAVIAYLRDQVEAGCGKIVVFAHHHDVQDALMREFGAAAVLHRGGIDDRARDAAVTRFQTDTSCRWFIGSIQAAGIGITLTASSDVRFVELSWVPSEISQAEKRLDRIGQRNSVLSQHLVLDGSLDARMARTLIEKQEVIDRALDSREDVSLPALPVEEPATASVRQALLAQEAATITPEQIAAVHLGLKMLAGMCDGAVARDGAGFSKVDAHIGRSLAEASGLTARQAILGRKLIRRYRRQLPEDVLSGAG